MSEGRHDPHEDRGDDVLCARTDVSEDRLQLLYGVTPVCHTAAQHSNTTLVFPTANTEMCDIRKQYT